MDYDEHEVDETVLALFWLTAWRDAVIPEGARGPGEPATELWRAWKGMDWDVLGRLHEAGWIGDPATKARSVQLTEAGRARAEALFAERFGKRGA